RLAVADDELSLAASDRHHRIDRLVAGLHRLAHRLAVDDAGCDALDRRVARGVDGAFAVDRIAERVHDASEQPLADGHFEDAAGRLDRVAFADVLVLAEHDRADRVLLEVQREPDAAAGEFQHFAVLGVGKTVDAHDTVRDGHDRTDVALFGGALELLDARLDEIADFRCLDGHCHSPQWSFDWLKAGGWRLGPEEAFLLAPASSLRPSASIRHGPCEPFEARFERAVDHEIARTNDRSANERRIHFTMQT